jgi:hypothetical protein
MIIDNSGSTNSPVAAEHSSSARLASSVDTQVTQTHQPLSEQWQSLVLPRSELRVCECVGSSALQKFVTQRDKLPADLLAFVTCYSAEEYARQSARLFLTADGNGGYGIHHGELISVFSLPGYRYGSHLVRTAIEHGAWHLSCFDPGGALTRFYGAHGFKQTSSVPWNQAYAPKEWNYKRFGTPDLIHMELPGELREESTLLAGSTLRQRGTA